MHSNHTHTHHHDESCSCGCHDEHHQTHHEASHHPQTAITVKTHETSIVGSYQFKIEGSFSEAEAILEIGLKQVAKEVTALGGIVGHIKALVKSEGETCMISITDEEANKHYRKSTRCRAEGVAIVFAILPKQLETILQIAFGDFIHSSI
jgi:hypothetical protein